MTPLERKRAAVAVAARLFELKLSGSELAEKAGVDAGTVRSVLRGERWPRERTCRLLSQALEWPDDGFTRAARNGSADLAGYTSLQLLEELIARERRREAARNFG